MTHSPIIAALLNPSLAHVVFSAGYDKTSSSALTTLSDAFVQYLAHLAQTAVGAASVAGRSRPTAKDVAVAVDLIGKGWPGGGMKDLLEWFEEEKKTRTTDEAAMFDGLGLPADEWITGFVTGGRTRIPNDEQEYSYVQDSTPSIGSREVEEADKTDVDMDMDMDMGTATEMETDETPLESSDSKTPSRRRPEYIPDHLPPFPDELSNSETGKGSEENDAKSGIPIVKKVQAGPTLDQSTKADKDATGSEDKSKTEVIPETISKSSERHATEKSDQQHEFFRRNNNVNAPSNTNGPISSNNHIFRSTASQSQTENSRSVLEAYTQIVPFAKSRLKEHTMTISANLNDVHAQLHALDPSATCSRRSSATSSAPSTSTAAKSPNSSRKLKVPHKDRPIRAIQELEKVLAALPAATASNGIHPMGTGLEAGIQFENALAEERSTDTLFGNSDISLLDKVVRKCSPHIMKLVTPTPIPIQPASSPVVGTSGPISAATSSVPLQRNTSIPSSTVNLGYPSTRLPLDRFDQSHHSISSSTINPASLSRQSSTATGTAGVAPYASHITGANITISHVPPSHGKTSSLLAMSSPSTTNSGSLSAMSLPSRTPVQSSSAFSSQLPSSNIRSLPPHFPSSSTSTPAPTIRFRLSKSTEHESATSPPLSAQPPETRPPSWHPSLNLGGVIGSTETAMEEEIRCVCLGVDDGTFMIACDRCQVWYHGRCVGVQELDAVEMWYCTRCVERGISFE